MPGDLLAGLAGPALSLVAGAGLQALAPRPLERSWVARLAFSYLLGAAWCSLTVWIANGLAGVEIAASSFLIVGALPAVAGLGVIAWRRGDVGGWRRAGRPASRRGRAFATLLACLLLTVTGGLLADAMLHPITDFDGRMTWGTLARYIEAERTALPSAVVDPDAYVIHPRYPLVLPLLQVGAAGLSGTVVESRAVRPTYALVYPALLFALWPALVRAGGRTAGGFAAAALAGAPVLLWDQEVGPLGTYADLALAAFLGGGLIVLLHPAARRQAWRGLLAGLLLAAAAGAKNEGLLLAPGVLAVVTLAGRRRGAGRAIGRAAGVLVVALALIVTWRSAIPNRNDEAYFESLSIGTIWSQLPARAPQIARGVAAATWDLGRWGLAFWILPGLCWIGRRGLASHASRAALGWLALHLSLVVVAYGATPDLAVVAVTWDRFLVQMLVPLMLVTAAAVRAAWVVAWSSRSA